ncbi:UPF0496 protein 3 [Phoenix dactylifera]|uniref:UPF0496 protein 3 n=1 Tax=Phoenix dactylifera TaxID=42345 RepID=A0A8B7C995_PHODC|nr:UPF0496 protein 3 [Phoenix dactylifera]
MHMKFSIFRSCKHQARRGKCEAGAPISSASFNLCEEYANTFRTESYIEFWARVLDLTLAHGAALKPRESSAAARLPSDRLFAEHLLDPDQPTVTRILSHVRRHGHPETHVLLSDYYAETANASLLCGLLLKEIEQLRLRYRPLKATLNSLISSGQSRLSLQAIDPYLGDLSKTLGPFDSLGSSQCQFRAVQDGSANLLKRLESSRKKARAKLRCINHLKRGLAIFLIVLTASTSALGVCMALHALVAVVALPTFLSAPPWLASAGSLARVLAQFDAAAKGTYILNRELDTISRLVARLHDEVEHLLALLRLCCERHDGGRRRLTQEVVRQIRKNDASFNQQLDELEEHLYLCFMTINKARSLVMKEVLVAGRG